VLAIIVLVVSMYVSSMC